MSALATLELPTESRYDRQALAGWSQERLRAARVVVVGAGATGNEVVKNLVLAGVGRILLVDLDRVAPSNLARCVLFRDEDVGRPKAEVVAQRAEALNPDVRVIPLTGDLEVVLGESYLAEADVVIGCLDNAYARFVLNRRVRKTGRGWIDVAISHDAAQVSAYGPDGACYACGLGLRTLASLRERFSCTGFRRITPASPVPTTVVTSALAGSLAAHLAIGAIHGATAEIGRRWTLLLGSPRWLVDELSPSAECPYAGRRRVRQPAPTPFGIGPGSTWREARTAMGLSPSGALLTERAIVTELACPSCGGREPRIGPVDGLSNAEAVCPGCATVREVITTQAVDDGSPASHVALARLGFGDGAWLTTRDGRSRRTWALSIGPGWDRSIT